ncbi:MAG TPA: hypothetical protein VNB87_13720 [Propionibacteriaceae bacterium]|nr:hypothetical protein [Propionibacteriaceae bacterium]
MNIWYPGTQGGYAAANLLFGAVSPGGFNPLTPTIVRPSQCAFDGSARAAHR